MTSSIPNQKPKVNSLMKDFFGKAIKTDTIFHDAILNCHEDAIQQVLSNVEDTIETKEGNKLYLVVKRERQLLLAKSTSFGPKGSAVNVPEHFRTLAAEFKYPSEMEVDECLSRIFAVTGQRRPNSEPGSQLISLSMFAIFQYCSKKGLTPPLNISNNLSNISTIASFLAYYFSTLKPCKNSSFSAIGRLIRTFTSEKSPTTWNKNLKSHKKSSTRKKGKNLRSTI